MCQTVLGICEMAMYVSTKMAGMCTDVNIVLKPTCLDWQTPPTMRRRAQREPGNRPQIAWSINPQGWSKPRKDPSEVRTTEGLFRLNIIKGFCFSSSLAIWLRISILKICFILGGEEWVLSSGGSVVRRWRAWVLELRLVGLNFQPRSITYWLREFRQITYLCKF